MAWLVSWVGVLLLALNVWCWAQDTGWVNPSLDYGEFLNGDRAYRRDKKYAVGAHAAVHHYGGFAIALPSDAEIRGIEVLVRARKGAAPDAYLGVELSWNGGTSWTATGHQAGPFAGSWREHTLGGATNRWGRSWTPPELRPGVFWVRVRAVNRVELDWVAVRVYYRSAVIQSLTVTPELVDFGSITLAHYAAGYRELSPAQRITVSSNVGWSLYVSADTPWWLHTGSEPDPEKPCSHLEWRVVAVGPGVTGAQTNFVGLTTAPQRVAGGAAGTGLWLEIALRLRVDYETTVPGTFELEFVYTLASP